MDLGRMFAKVARTSPLSVSKTLAVFDELSPQTIFLPSGLRASCQNPSPRTSSVRTSSPVFGSHTFSPSETAVKRRVTSQPAPGLDMKNGDLFFEAQSPSRAAGASG